MKVSQYPLATSVESADLMYVVQGGVSKSANLNVPWKFAQLVISASLTLTGATVLGAPTWVSTQAMNISGSAASATNAAHATLADTVTTNANLTGPITSVGNATSIASGNTYANPTLTGTVSGTPAWASGQTFPSVATSGILTVGTNFQVFGDTALFGSVGADSATKILVRGTAQAIRIGTSAGSAGVEAVDNTGVASYQPLKLNGSTVDIGIAGTSRIGIAASGAVTIPVSVATPLVGTSTDALLALMIGGTSRWAIQPSASNYDLIPSSNDNTQSFGMPSSRIKQVFTPIIDSGTAAAIALKTNNGAQGFSVGHTANSVNYLEASGSASTGHIAGLGATGSDANIDILYFTKGTGTHSWNTGGAQQFQVLHTASAVRNATITGAAAGGNPTIGVTGGSLAITPAVVLGGALTMGGTLTVGANTLALATSTVSGTPTWSSNQAITLSTAAQPNITSVGTLSSLAVSGTITMSAAVSKIVPGATSFSHRNTADSADNLLITDAGVATFRNTVNITTQSALDNSTKAASTAYVDSAVTASSGTVGMGTGTGVAKIGGIASINTTLVNSVGATSDLMSYTLPANSLSANGKGLRITCWGITANNANAKTVGASFGGGAIGGAPALTVSQAGTWKLVWEIFRTGASAQVHSLWYYEGNGGTFPTMASTHKSSFSGGATSASVETGALVIKMIATGTAGGDVAQQGMLVEFFN